MPSKAVVTSTFENNLAVGLDDKIYSGALGASALTQFGSYTVEPDLISATSNYGVNCPPIFLYPTGYTVLDTTSGAMVAQNLQFDPADPIVETKLAATYSMLMRTKAGKIYFLNKQKNAAHDPADPSTWMLIHTDPDISALAIGGGAYNWDGSSTTIADSDNIIIIKKDGTAWIGKQVKTSPFNPAITFSQIPGISDAASAIVSHGNTFMYILNKDGSKIYVGGNNAEAHPPFFASPSGDTWKSIGGNYRYTIFLTEQGRVFLHSKASYCGSAFEFSPVTGATAADANAITELTIPKPVETLSVSSTSPGGYGLMFLLPD